jgi:plastocyanin
MPLTPLAVLMSAGALALTVAGCGSSSSPPASSSASSSSAATTTAAATTSAASGGGSATAGATTKLSLGVMGQNLMYNTKTLSAKPGTVEIVFTNNSGIPHNVTVQKGTDGTVLGATPTFSGGSHTLTLHLAAGTYTFYCSVPGHRQAGMFGTLTVSS